MYKLYMNLPQTDFRRYIQHARFYTARELAIASIVIKDELKTNLGFLPENSEDVMLELFACDAYKLSIVFAFKAKDVYFRMDYTPNNDEHWIAIVNKDEDNTSYTNQSYVQEQDFEDNCSKPIKLLIAMYYPQIRAFLEEEMNRLKESMDLVKRINKKIEEDINKSDEKDVIDGVTEEDAEKDVMEEIMQDEEVVEESKND